MRKIVAVIVTYNRKELLRKCILHVQNQINITCDIIIVDNCSSDGTADMIVNEFELESIIYLNTGTNLGGAGGFRYGLQKAVLLGYEYVWVMDDDTLPQNDTLYELWKASDKLNGKWGFLSSVAYWKDGNICRMNIQKKTIFRHISKKDYAIDLVPIKMCSFVSLLIKADTIKEVGLPIADYFIWTDDYEFTGRISSNYISYMVSSSKVVHAMEKHMRVNFALDDGNRLERYKYIYRNDVHCYRQYGMIGWLYIILKDIYTIFNIIRNSREEKMKKIRIMLMGFYDGLSFNPEIETVYTKKITAEDEIWGGVISNANLCYFLFASFRLEVAE